VAVIIDPASDERVEHPSQVVELLVAPGLKGPTADHLTNRFECLGAGCRKKRQPVQIPLPFRSPGSKRIPKKVESTVWISTGAIGILAVDHLRLFWMEHQSTFGEPPL